MNNNIERIRIRTVRPYGWLKSQKQRFVHPGKETEPIDFVVTWVDGNDPEWQRNKAYYSEEIDHNSNTEARYRDWDLLRYWFRAVDQYAPWVRKIFFVTCGQKPEWLDFSHEKLVFVTHDEFIPKEYLPTFNANTIELNLWRIKDLSEHFVYFNDDMFINCPVQPEVFFSGGLPRICSLAIPLNFQCPIGYWGDWNYTLLNSVAVINATFDLRLAIRSHPEKFFSYIYKRNSKYNQRVYKDNYLTGMYHAHSAQIYLKSIFMEIWDRCYQHMDRTCQSRFRSIEQHTSFFPTLWQIFKGLYEPVSTDFFGKLLRIEDIPRIEKALKSNDIRILCINDNESTDKLSESDRLSIKESLHNAMEIKFPKQSAYEK